MANREATRSLDRARARRQLRTPALARSMRLQAGLTLQEVGKALGVTGVAVRRWEIGDRTPRGDLAVEYLSFLRRACEEAGA